MKSKKSKDTEDEIIVGLDVGTTKICAIVAQRKENNNINIIGIGKPVKRSSQGNCG